MASVMTPAELRRYAGVEFDAEIVEALTRVPRGLDPVEGDEVRAAAMRSDRTADAGLTGWPGATGHDARQFAPVLVAARD